MILLENALFNVSNQNFTSIFLVVCSFALRVFEPVFEGRSHDNNHERECNCRFTISVTDIRYNLGTKNKLKIDLIHRFLREIDRTYLKKSQDKEIDIGKFRELGKEVHRDEREPIVLSGTNSVVSEANLLFLALVIDHEIPGVRACDFRIVALSTSIRRVRILLWDLLNWLAQVSHAIVMGEGGESASRRRHDAVGIGCFGERIEL